MDDTKQERGTDSPNTRGSAQTLMNFSSEPRKISQSAELCTWVTSLQPGNKLTEQQPSEIDLGITQIAQWNTSQSLLSLWRESQEEDSQRKLNAGEAACSSTVSYFKSPKSKKNMRSWKGSPNSLELWGWCLRIRWWSWVCLVSNNQIAAEDEGALWKQWRQTLLSTDRQQNKGDSHKQWLGRFWT